jgi:hypothetical protein
MSTPIRTHIVRDWRGGHRLVLVQDHMRGEINVCVGFEWVTRGEGDMFDSQDGIGNADELIQGIVNKAWDAGFRPVGFADVKNETTAMQRHLDDLRKIAFHHLSIEP